MKERDRKHKNQKIKLVIFATVVAFNGALLGAVTVFALFCAIDKIYEALPLPVANVIIIVGGAIIASILVGIKVKRVLDQYSEQDLSEQDHTEGE